MKSHIYTSMIFSSAILVVGLADSSYAATLSPSISDQMQINQSLQKDLQVQEVKSSNLNKLIALREKVKIANLQKQIQVPAKTVIIASQTKTINSTLPITPQIQPTVSQPKPVSVVSVGSDPVIAGVDMNRVRSTWLSWYNDTRTSAGLGTLSYDARLDVTASQWNEVFLAGKGQNHHERSAGDGYYNFAKISEWFADRGVVGKIKNGTTTVENVGYGYYSCNSGDCTDAMIKSIRTTFDFYMREKAANGAHYRSIMGSAFTKIGLSIRVVPSENRYYMTIHYITDFE